MHCSPMRADNNSSLHDSQVMALRMHFNPMRADSHSNLLERQGWDLEHVFQSCVFW